MKDIGEMTCNMDMVLKHGQMEANMKDITMKVKSMGKEHTLGVTEVVMLVIGLIIK